jgi:hypothetical protein
MIPSGRFGTIRISASFITNVIMTTIAITTTIATDGATKKTTMDEIITGETTEANMMNEAIAAAYIADRNRLDVDSECFDATHSISSW